MKHKPTHVSSIINNLIRSLSNRGFSREIKIGFLWNRSVGELLSRKTRITKLEYDNLFVLVDNNVWLQELILQKETILEKINKNLNKTERVKDIFFSLSSKKIDF